MNVFKLEQFRMVLSVLEQMKDCLDRDETFTTVKGKPFNVSKSFGICWHVYAHTGNHLVTGISTDFLYPYFVEMGLHNSYPVEFQFTDSPISAFHYQRNMYDRDNLYGQARIKLVDDLIVFFTEKMKQPITETMYSVYLQRAKESLEYSFDAYSAVWDVLDYDHNMIWSELAERIVLEDSTLGMMNEGVEYPDHHAIHYIVTTNIQHRIQKELEHIKG